MEIPQKNVNWHAASVAALKIDLRDFSDLLTFNSEAYLWKKHFRIDLVVVHKNTDTVIPKPLADRFQAANLFEIKGIGSSVTIQSFYKTVGYAGLYASENWGKSSYNMKDIAIFFLSRNYPQKLITHLQKKCGFKVENISPGIVVFPSTSSSRRCFLQKSTSTYTAWLLSSETAISDMWKN